MAIFHPFEIRRHVLAGPTRVSGKVRDIVPVRFVGTDQNHGVVSRASTQGACAWVQYAIYTFVLEVLIVIRIKPLLSVVGVVTHKEVPADCFVFGSKCMK